MKRKYRIKEYVKANGMSYFKIEYRFMFFWFEHFGLYNHYQNALEKLEELRGMEVVKTRIINHE